MRLTGYCTAERYNIKQLFEALTARGFKPNLLRDTIHVSYTNSFGEHCDVFIFPFAAVVFWSFEDSEEQDFLKYLKSFETNPTDSPEFDEFSFTTGSTLRVSRDEVCLPFPSALNKLAVSYAIAQSVKLTIFETTIRATIENTRHLPEEMFAQGKIVRSRSQLAKTIGHLFLERNSINLHTDILDTPEIFWEYPESEPVYRIVANYLDLQPRVGVLNQRLTIVKELLEMLAGELNHRHTSRLEWIIITLISFEIFLVLSKEFGHWFS